MICPPLYCPNHYTFTIWLEAGGTCPVCQPKPTDQPIFTMTEEELGTLAFLIGLGADDIYERYQFPYRNEPSKRIRQKADWGRAFISRLAARHKGKHPTILEMASCQLCGEVRDGSYTGYPT